MKPIAWTSALLSTFLLGCAAAESVSPAFDDDLTAVDAGTEPPLLPTSLPPPPTSTVPTPPAEMQESEESCTAVAQRAEAAVEGSADVIMLVDTSGSMIDEIAAVKANLNRFAQQIVAGGIDVQLILLAQNSVCIEAPLGSGLCGGLADLADDTKPPSYTHVNQTILSTDALVKLQDRLPDWLGLLRPEARKHIFVVTDDNSSLSAASFATWTQSVRLLIEPSLTISGMFCAQDVGNCASAGVVYTSLVLQTGGVAGDLSQLSDVIALNAEFDRVFAKLADVLIAEAVPVDCEWEIPDLDSGEVLDPDRVNLRYTASSGKESTIPGVDAVDNCDSTLGGWYYDDPAHPTRVLACEATCTTIQSDAQAKIDLLFGCERKQLVR